MGELRDDHLLYMSSHPTAPRRGRVCTPQSFKHHAPRVRRKEMKTTVNQIRANAFKSIMEKIDFTFNYAERMPMGENRKNFVFEKSSEINKLIYVCDEIGALTAKQHAELTRLNMFV